MLFAIQKFKKWLNSALCNKFLRMLQDERTEAVFTEHNIANTPKVPFRFVDALNLCKVFVIC